MDIRADPYLDDGMIGFINSFARKNHWRVASWLDLDDLVQDGWMKYYKVRRHPNYAALNDKTDPTPDDRRQMMALVRTALTHHVHGLASRRTATPEDTFASLVMRNDSPRVEDALSATACADGIGVVLASAPRELVELVMIIAGDAVRAAQFVYDASGTRETIDQHLLRLRSGDGDVKFQRSRVRRVGARLRLGGRAVRETTNEAYCRLLGLDPREHDVRGLIKNYLTG